MNKNLWQKKSNQNKLTQFFIRYIFSIIFFQQTNICIQNQNQSSLHLQLVSILNTDKKLIKTQTHIFLCKIILYYQLIVCSKFIEKIQQFIEFLRKSIRNRIKYKIMQILLKALIFFSALFKISKAASCSSCLYGCCDYYGNCPDYKGQCAYYSCYYCSINGNCATYSECNSTSSKVLIIIICVIVAVVVVGFAICFYIRYKKRQRIEQIRQKHLQAQLNSQNDISNNSNATQQVAIGYPVPDYNQHAYQNQNYYANNQIPYSGNIGQISANQHPSQQYQCTIPTGEAIPHYQIQQQHPQLNVQPGYPAY
ncbi:transmembrane protein, putative (macronuclear) [Tetrahymena thermophila SB210]|uniref:Transmembrane protein, putative n=1 Tax=Tetrahymena thermophila (strain SB210) TaxID=312017 RepID=I7LUN6_TETTS|nr:transmembrane protein, putative [Tetrahymena thermophila SB210]EAR95041.2 transmembrane protein, putative [Tetrahymena thermophila SB210]|eukprot:XP_001015286.2 transmembrane protein, putative [Tetrahymena thermophila SB210]